MRKRRRQSAVQQPLVDQHLCFRYIDHIDSTIPLFSKSENPKFQASNHILRLYRTRSETPKTGSHDTKSVLNVQTVHSLKDSMQAHEIIVLIKHEPRCKKTLSSGFQTRSDTSQAVQPQEIARDLKFQI